MAEPRVFRVAGNEIKLWRLVVFALVFFVFCVLFDVVYTTDLRVDMPVELAFLLYLDWLFPAVYLLPTAKDAMKAYRRLRAMRREQEDDE